MRLLRADLFEKKLEWVRPVIVFHAEIAVKRAEKLSFAFLFWRFVFRDEAVQQRHAIPQSCHYMRLRGGGCWPESLSSFYSRRGECRLPAVDTLDNVTAV